MASWTFRLLLVSLITIVSCKNDTLSVNNIELNNLMNILRVVQPENLLNSMIDDEINNRVTVNSTKCKIQLEYLLNGIGKSELWALKMLDSSSKIQSGILTGNLKDLGMWDECHSIKINKENELIQGQHCMYTVSVKEQRSNISLSASLSICLPATCSADMIYEALNYLINMTPNNAQILPTLKKVKCSPVESKPWKIGEIIVLFSFIIFFIFLIICTLCDIYYKSTLPRLNDNSTLECLSKFSIYSNAKKMLSMKVPSGNLPAIHGIRFFSMTWVVLGHEYFIQMMSATINQAEFVNWTHSWNSLYIMVAPFSVDTFFAISGFLTSYLFIKEINKGRKFNPIMYYLHRYWRLTPTVVVLLLFMIFFYRRMGSGAIWESNIALQEDACIKEWWSYLLYMQNFRGINTMNCLGHTWYLAVDMHFFWMSPLILYPLAKRPKIGLTILFGFIIASIIIPTIISLTNKYSGGIFTVATINGIIDMMEHYYTVSYTRAGPWLLGVYLGYKIAVKKNKPTKIFVWFGWTMTLFAFCFCIFSYRIFQNVDYEFVDWWEGFYAGLARHIWAGGICWIIYASIHGFGGILSTFLSLPIFLPFGRISYSIYLIHYVYEYMRLSAIRSPNYFDDFRTIQAFLGDYVAIIVISFFFSLVFESPFLAFEKIILGTNKTTKSKTEFQNGDAEIGETNHAYKHDIPQTYNMKKEEY